MFKRFLTIFIVIILSVSMAVGCSVSENNESGADEDKILSPGELLKQFREAESVTLEYKTEIYGTFTTTTFKRYGNILKIDTEGETSWYDLDNRIICDEYKGGYNFYPLEEDIEMLDIYKYFIFEDIFQHGFKTYGYLEQDGKYVGKGTGNEIAEGIFLQTHEVYRSDNGDYVYFEQYRDTYEITEEYKLVFTFDSFTLEFPEHKKEDIDESGMTISPSTLCTMINEAEKLTVTEVYFDKETAETETYINEINGNIIKISSLENGFITWYDTENNVVCYEQNGTYEYDILDKEELDYNLSSFTTDDIWFNNQLYTKVNGRYVFKETIAEGLLATEAVSVEIYYENGCYKINLTQHNILIGSINCEISYEFDCAELLFPKENGDV